MINRLSQYVLLSICGIVFFSRITLFKVVKIIVLFPPYTCYFAFARIIKASFFSSFLCKLCFIYINICLFVSVGFSVQITYRFSRFFSSSFSLCLLSKTCKCNSFPSISLFIISHNNWSVILNVRSSSPNVRLYRKKTSCIQFFTNAT